MLQTAEVHTSKHSFFDDSFVGLAPMEGVTDLPARLWFGLVSSPDFVCTPFLRVTDSFPATGTRNQTEKNRLPETYAPELDQLNGLVPYKLIPQLMASDCDAFCRVSEILLKIAPFVDLNCGCPSPKVVGHGAGSSLLSPIDRFIEFGTLASRRLGDKKLSIKLRTGYQSEGEFPEILAAFEAWPLHHITIHGRTRVQGYKGLANWQLIHQAASKIHIPVMGSGDIVHFADQRISDKRVNAVIIGRGALKNPWIFEEIRQQRSCFPDRATLKYCIACFATLNALATDAISKLFELAKDGVFATALPTDERSWKSLLHVLSTKLCEASLSPQELPFNKFNLGRTKMLWSYLSQSFNQTVPERSILRARDYKEFFHAMDASFLKSIQYH